MLIYLDSSDLINYAHGLKGRGVQELAEKLNSSGHQLVLSFQTLMEFSWSLLNKDQILEARRDLNALDQLPAVFVNDGTIAHQEYLEAMHAFQEHREWDPSKVSPIAGRLCDAIDIEGRRFAPMVGGVRVELVNVGTAETMLNLWRTDRHAFSVHRRRQAEWLWMMRKDRSMAAAPNLEDHFVVATERSFRLRGFLPPFEGIEKLARWIYESPSRCPGIRITYETHHRFRRDQSTRPKASDMIDLGRVHALPYVDFFVTDKRMMRYCREAAKEIGVSYTQLLGTFDEVLSHLGLS